MPRVLIVVNVEEESVEVEEVRKLASDEMVTVLRPKETKEDTSNTTKTWSIGGGWLRGI